MQCHFDEKDPLADVSREDLKAAMSKKSTVEVHKLLAKARLEKEKRDAWMEQMIADFRDRHGLQ